MQKCWSAEPSERPLLGYVQPQLETIYNRAIEPSGKLNNNNALPGHKTHQKQCDNCNYSH